MKYRYIKICGLILISHLIISCGKKPLECIDFTDGNYKMFFFYQTMPPSMIEPNEFKDKYKQFYIDDNATLETIKSTVTQGKVRNYGHSMVIYILRLEKDGKFVDGGILGIESNVFYYYNGVYKFDFNELEKLNNYFKKLNSFEVNCITASHTNDFIEFVEKSSGYIYGSEFEKMSLKGIKGKIDLTTTISRLSLEKFEDWSQVEKILLNDIEKIGIIKSSHLVGDSIFLTLLLKDYSIAKIPEKYEVVKPFSDTINAPLQVINNDLESLVTFFEINNITEFEIKDLN
jgi:hypothetical protein